MASVLDALLEGVAEAFAELDSVAQAVTYQVTGTPTYNTTTGAVTNPTTNVSLRGFIGSFKHREIDGTVVRVGDKKLMVERAVAEAAAVTAGTVFTPKLEDRVTVGGVVHQVVDWTEDPARATVELQIRRAV